MNRPPTFSVKRDRDLDNLESVNVKVDRLLVTPSYPSLFEPLVAASPTNAGALAFDKENGVPMFSDGTIWRDMNAGIPPQSGTMFLRYNTGASAGSIVVGEGTEWFLLWGQNPEFASFDQAVTLIPRPGVLTNLTARLTSVIPSNAAVVVNVWKNVVASPPGPVLTVNATLDNTVQDTSTADVSLGDLVLVSMTAPNGSTPLQDITLYVSLEVQ